MTVPISEFTCGVCGEAFVIVAAPGEHDERIACPPAPADCGPAQVQVFWSGQRKCVPCWAFPPAADALPTIPA